MTISNLGDTSLLISAGITESSDVFVYNSYFHNICNMLITEPHYFRIDIDYTETIGVGIAHDFERPALVASLYFSLSLAIIKWLPSTIKLCDNILSSDMRGPESVRIVCDKIVYQINDPQCHVGLAKKIYTAMFCYIVSKQQLPPH